jgi:hypothetical protein
MAAYGGVEDRKEFEIEATGGLDEVDGLHLAVKIAPRLEVVDSCFPPVVSDTEMRI